MKKRIFDPRPQVIHLVRGLRSGAASIRQKTKQAFVGKAGQATVEFAVVLPLLLMLVTGIVSFAIAMFDKQELQVAASQGVQEVVLRQHGYDADPCGTSTTAIKSTTQLNSSMMGITFLNGGPAGTSISGYLRESSSGHCSFGETDLSVHHAVDLQFQPNVLTYRIRNGISSTITMNHRGNSHEDEVGIISQKALL